VQIDSAIETISNHPLFLKSKAVVENNAYHTHEDVYSHSLKTLKIAREQITANFITDNEAKQKFLSFVSEDYGGVTRADCMVLTALLHDFGKILSVKENGQVQSILITNTQGITACPGHEYFGSTIVDQLLTDLSLPHRALEHIRSVVRLHDTFNEQYFAVKKEWTIDALLHDIKARAENYYIEALFNIRCDCFTAPPYQEALARGYELFNNPRLYFTRTYSIA
jgi:hypothetical protein